MLKGKRKGKSGNQTSNLASMSLSKINDNICVRPKSTTPGESKCATEVLGHGI